MVDAFDHDDTSAALMSLSLGLTECRPVCCVLAVLDQCEYEWTRGSAWKGGQREVEWIGMEVK